MKNQKRNNSQSAKSRHLLFWVLMLVGALLLGYTPGPSVQKRPLLHSLTLAERGQPLIVYVVDLLTKAPIPGAFVRMDGVQRVSLTDRDGRAALTLPAGVTTLAVSVERQGYMGTKETRISAVSTSALVLAMPPLAKLKQADRLIRDPRTLDPHRHQTQVSGLSLQRASWKTTKKLPIGTPVALTYPIPKTIQVKKTNGQIITLGLEEYLKGVLPKEIGSSFPMEAMKAQAVAARTYTIQYTQGGKKPICTTTACQVWGTTQYAATTKAVLDTAGQVSVYMGSDSRYKGTLTGGYFAASCGGATSDSEKRGWSYRPYLRGVPCIENKKGACSVVCSLSTCGGGRCPSSHPTCWGVFGHRIGLCQRGAQAMGKCGKSYVEIIKHYYTGAEIANLSVPQVDNAELVSESPAAGATMRAAQSFTKSWIIKNTGNTTWSGANGYRLKRLDGTAFAAGDVLLLPNQVQVAPGKTHNFSIQLKAPTTPGSYKSRWQMEHNSKKFGPVVEVSIIVKAAPSCKDNDGDGYFAPAEGCQEPFDCDDNNKDIHPHAREICGNGKDDDCSAGDMPCPTDCKDSDKDGYFAPNSKCPGPYDCDDNDNAIHPGAREICANDKDDDCKDGDATCPTDCQDKDGDGYGVGKGCAVPYDCDDNDKNVYPGAPEICGNGKDEDCREGDKPCNATPPARRPPPPPKKKLGESGCAQHSDCETSICVEYAGKKLCSQRCGAGQAACPSGYTCVQDAACWPSTQLPPGVSVDCRRSTDCPKGNTCINNKCLPSKRGCGCESGEEGESFLGLWWLLLLYLGMVKVPRLRAGRKPSV